MDAVPKCGDRMTDKAVVPDGALVRGWIGPQAFRHWSALQEWIASSYPDVFKQDWIYGGKKHGWCLRYKKSRAFCTLVPEYRAFSVVVVLGEAERQKVQERRALLSQRLMDLYESAQTYADGKWLQVGVTSVADLKDVTELLALKRAPERADP